MLPRHDARIPHILGEDIPCTLLVVAPRCRTSARLPSPEDESAPEVVGALISGEHGPAIILSQDDALMLDGQPDALARIERAAREGVDEADVDGGTYFTPWAVCL